MNPNRVLVLAVLAVGIAPIAPAAEPALMRFSFEERHMGTRFGILVHAANAETAGKAARAAFARVNELNAIMSDYLPTSELMRLCAKAGGPPVKVSDELFTVLARAQRVSEQSDGAFDVTVGPVVRLWRRSRRTREMPDPEKLKAARALVGYRMVRLDPKARTVQLARPGMQLDLGGIAKGYAADEMLRVLRQHGLTRALVAAGGDLTAADPPPGKTAWTVEIAPVDARKEGPRLLSLVNAAVSTSGDAEQAVEIGGKRYSHIVDPKTGLGLIGRMSATVIAPDGITADSLTKVIAVLGPKKGFPILAKWKGVQGRFVRRTEEGLKVATTKGFPVLRAGGKE